MSSYFVLINDINLADLGPATFNMIGAGADTFTGVFDGNDQVIRNFTWSGSANNAGLFSKVGAAGTVKRLRLERVNVNAGSGMYAGALAGVNYGTIEQSSSTGSVEAFQGTGGLVGHNDGLVSKSYSACVLYASDDAPGGLVGYNAGSLVDSYA